MCFINKLFWQIFLSIINNACVSLKQNMILILQQMIIT